MLKIKVKKVAKKKRAFVKFKLQILEKYIKRKKNEKKLDQVEEESDGRFGSWNRGGVKGPALQINRQFLLRPTLPSSFLSL